MALSAKPVKPMPISERNARRCTDPQPQLVCRVMFVSLTPTVRRTSRSGLVPSPYGHEVVVVEQHVDEGDPGAQVRGRLRGLAVGRQGGEARERAEAGVV